MACAIESKKLKLLITAANALLWTLLSAILISVSYGQIKAIVDDYGWPAHGTFAWIAAGYSLLAVFSAVKEFTSPSGSMWAHIASYGCILCLFSGIVVAQLAPVFVGKWKYMDDTSKTSWMKMDLCSVIFSTFGIVSGYALNTHILHMYQHEKCKVGSEYTEPQ